MQNTKILEMLNNGQVEKLKTLIQKEIFLEGLKAKPDAKRRYTAMKKYFSYVKNVKQLAQCRVWSILKEKSTLLLLMGIL